MTNPAKPLRLVRVVWEDASVVDDDTWNHKDSLPQPKVIIFDQVGWLMELTAHHVVLSACVGETMISARDRIPAGMVRSITEFSVDGGVPLRIPKARRKKAE